MINKEVVLNERQTDAVNSVKQYFADHPFFDKAVIGISGGKDSSVVAAMLANALGPDNVIGVIMPNIKMNDIDDARGLAFILGIKCIEIDITEAYNGLRSAFVRGVNKYNMIDELDTSTKFERFDRIYTNIPPRLRMTTLYAVAALVRGCVVGTGNRSENYLGWGTLWGDTACDFNPIQGLYCDEVVELGKYFGLPERLYAKAPSDGLTGRTDEENFGFTYADVKRVSEAESTGRKVESHEVDLDAQYKIAKMHNKNKFKSEMIYVPGPKY